MVEGLFSFLFCCESGIKEWYIKNANLPFRKDFKFAELLTTKTFFSLTLETVLKMVKETN